MKNIPGIIVVTSRGRKTRLSTTAIRSYSAFFSAHGAAPNENETTDIRLLDGGNLLTRETPEEIDDLICDSFTRIGKPGTGRQK